MSNSKEVADNSTQHEAHSGASAKHAQDATNIAGQLTKMTTVHIPDQEQDTKASGKRTKFVAAAMLTLFLLVAGSVGAFFHFRLSNVATDEQIKVIMQFLETSKQVKYDIFKHITYLDIGCYYFFIKPEQEKMDEARWYFKKFELANSKFCLGDDSPLPAKSSEQVVWLKNHPYLAQHYYQVANLYFSNQSNGSFSKAGYALILGFDHLHTLLPAHVVASNKEAQNVLCDVILKYRSTLEVGDLTLNEVVLPEILKSPKFFVENLIQGMCMFARYTFVASRWNAKDKDGPCTGEELHRALPKLFPCVPKEGQLGGSFAEHIGRTYATYTIAQYFFESKDNINPEFVASWVCAGFDPVTGTANIYDAQRHYDFMATPEELRTNSVSFKNFVKRRPFARNF